MPGLMVSTWSLLRESMQLVLGAVPPDVDVDKVAAHLRAQPGVTGIHDLHIWAMSTTQNALTVHLVMPGSYPGDQAFDAITAGLKKSFAIHHCTLQMEQGTTDHACALDGHAH